MRRQGMSVRDITKLTGASKASVSLWVRDIELTEAQQDALKEKQRRWAGRNQGGQVNRKKGLERRQVYQEAGRVKAREMRPLHLAGCMLYWAEGAKSRNTVHFINSDPHMMGLFIRFLREELEVSEAEFVVYIHCHTQDEQEIERIKTYWLDLLKLPPSALRKVLYKKGSVIRNRVIKNGVCTVRVYRSELLQHIYGAIQEYGGFENPEWLF
ncbi:MAG: hypothetical protein HXY41_04625 [Chloroflexi bacterium]|nr:hypothetical protein [Chloroflexota bacterium]